MAPPPPPRCPGTWLLGNARALLDDTAGAIVDGYRACGPVFRMRAAWRPFTMIAGPEAGEVFERRLDETHLSRHRIFEDVEREFGPCPLVLAHGGDTHARLRPLLALAFSRQAVSPRVPAMSDAVRAEVRAWPAGRPLPGVRRMQALALAAYGALLGLRGLVFDDWRLVTDYMMNVTAGQVPPIVFRAPWYRRAHRRNYAVLRGALAAMRRGAVTADAPTLLESLASADAPGHAPLTDEEVVSYAAYGVGASLGYVGRLGAFLLYELLRDAALLAAVLDEVRAGFADGLVDARDVRRMAVLRSACYETLRLHPFAIGMPFEVETPFEFHGRTVSPGGRLIVSPVPAHFSPAAFPEPHRFDASRCRDPRNEHRAGALHPFGLGHRTCSAMGLVETMTITLVATLLHERAVAMHPPGYRLRRSVWPLPAPDRRFRIQVTAPSLAPAAIARPDVVEEDVLATFPGYDDPAVRDALASAATRSHAPGAAIVRQGDVADAFYVIEAGDAIVTRDGHEPVATLGAGEWFGETGLLTHAPRNATVTAGPGGTAVRRLPRDAFLAMVAASDLVASEIGALLRKRMAAARLRQAAPQLTADAGARVLPEFRARTCGAGETIVQQGAPASEFFVIVSGEVDVRRGGEVVARLGPGDYFGEAGLLHQAPRNASVVAGGAPVELLVTDIPGFERLLGESGGRRGELARAMLARAVRLAP